MNIKEKVKTNGRVLFRLSICGAILLFGILALFALKGMKKPPAEVEVKVHSLRVETRAVQPENVEVKIGGFGQERKLNQ